MIRIQYEAKGVRHSRWFVDAERAQDLIAQLQAKGIELKVKRFSEEEVREMKRKHNDYER